MPNIKQAKKRLLITAKQTIRNSARKTRCKNTEKLFLAKITESDNAGAEECLKDVFATLDKAAQKGTIHKNKANRKKAQLAKKLTNLG